MIRTLVGSSQAFFEVLKFIKQRLLDVCFLSLEEIKLELRLSWDRHHIDHVDG